jgi:hypothetical protein
MKRHNPLCRVGPRAPGQGGQGQGDWQPAHWYSFAIEVDGKQQTIETIENRAWLIAW